MRRVELCFILVVILMLSRGAHACSCVGRATCGAFQIHDTLLVGKALSVRTIESKVAKTTFQTRRHIYRFEVSESLTGATHAPEIVEIETGMGGGDCGYDFKLGERYFVDATQRGVDGRLSTSICSGTQSEIVAQSIIREVRAILARERLPDLSGVISRLNSLHDLVAYPIAGVTVHLNSPNGESYTAVTDSAGAFTVFQLPAAEYRVTYDLPTHLVTYNDAIGVPQIIKIPQGGEPACHVNAVVLTSGTISGKVIDATGKPIRSLGIVSLRRTGELHDEGTGGSPDTDGQFTIHFVRAGEYQMVYRIYGQGPVRETRLERSVILKDGEHLAGIILVAIDFPGSL